MGEKQHRVFYSAEEDQMLKDLVTKFGENNWHTISKHMVTRNPRQCRDRWEHFLSPRVKNGEWTQEEDILLQQKQSEMGPKWKEMTAFFQGRSYVNIKNRFHLLMRRKNKHERDSQRMKRTFSHIMQKNTVDEHLNEENFDFNEFIEDASVDSYFYEELEMF